MIQVIQILRNNQETLEVLRKEEKVSAMEQDELNPSFWDKVDEVLEFGGDYKIIVRDTVTNKQLTTILKLYDDASTHEKFTVMNKVEVMADDSRNPFDFWLELDDFIVFERPYEFTLEVLK